MPKLGNPLPQALPKECAKAVRIFNSFVDSGNNGLDGIIPRSVLERASGFAIFTIFKAGFLFSARGGGGIVIARLDDGSWSAPSAIGLAGVGMGGQAGAEMTDFLIVLNSRSAVRSFMAAGSLTLGGNISLAVGPLGRNGEASTSVNTSGKVAAMYSYSKTRGLFGGVSVEGSVIVERQDANAQAYRSDVSAKQILSGSVTPPEWAQSLIHTLETRTSTPGGRTWVLDGQPSPDSQYAFSGISSSNAQVPQSLRDQQRKTRNAGSFPPDSWGTAKSTGSYFSPPSEEAVSGSAWDYDHAPRIDDPPPFETLFESDFVPAVRPHVRHTPGQSLDLSTGNSPRTAQKSTHARSSSSITTTTNPFYSKTERENDGYEIATPFGPTLEDEDNPFGPGTRSVEAAAARHREAERERILSRPLAQGEGVARAVALFDFRAVEPGDLSFLKGQVVTITEKSDNTDTWWKGKLDGKEGSFPANFVEIV
jgi:lipid-binding SYLF domain-containing protein